MHPNDPLSFFFLLRRKVVVAGFLVAPYGTRQEIDRGPSALFGIGRGVGSLSAAAIFWAQLCRVLSPS